jgi:Mg-chelatase subunit ChlD
MRFTHPEFLVLALSLVWFWRAGARSGAPRRVLRCSAVVLLTLALSGVQVRRGESPVALVFALDWSGSMAAARVDFDATLRAASASMHTGDRAAAVIFGASAAVERPLAPTIDPPRTASAAIGTSTNIAAALRLARGVAPGGGARRIVLLSDGRETEGDALAEAARSGADGIPIDVVIPAETRPSTEMTVVRVTAPQTVRLHDTFPVLVTVRGTPDTDGLVSLKHSRQEQLTAPVHIGADGLGAASFSVVAKEAGINVLEASARSKSTDGEFEGEPQTAGAVVAVSGDTNVLFVGGGAELLRAATAAAGIRQHSATLAQFPRSAGALAPYDAVILSDPDAEHLDAQQVSALRTHVERQGGGLLFLGTAKSLDAGVLPTHALADLLPIDVRPRAGQRAPAVGLVVAFDKSGSMGDRVDGVPRIEFARAAVRRVFDAVPASDFVGVIAFDAEPHVIAPYKSAHDTRVVATQLQTVLPSGATAIAPALDVAARWLRESPPSVTRRHVLLVSDGRTTPADITQLRAIIAPKNFELSVVALGEDADRTLLESLARSTGGRAYYADDIRELPAIVARESTRVAGGRLYEDAFTPVVRAHPIVAGLGTAVLPQLGGYVVSVAKPSAESPLESPRHDPVLASWRMGLGRVAVYTADLQGAWSARLRDWAGFAPLIGQTVRWLSRVQNDDTMYLTFDEESDGLRLTLEAQTAAGLGRNELHVHATVRAPDDTVVNVPLQGVAPGRYEGRFKTSAPGAYVAAVSGVPDDGVGEARLVRGMYWHAEREYRATAPDLALLTKIAETSGGRLLQARQPFAIPRTSAYVDAWRWAALGALIVFLAELLLPSLASARRLSRGTAQPTDPQEKAA